FFVKPFLNSSARIPLLKSQRIPHESRSGFGSFCISTADKSIICGIAASSRTPQELSCPRLLRMGENLLRRPLLGNQPAVKEDNPVGDLTSETHFVSHHNHGHAFIG